MGGPTHEWVGPPIVTHGANKGGPFFRGANRLPMHTNPLSKGEPIGWGAIEIHCTAMDSVAANRRLNIKEGNAPLMLLGSFGAPRHGGKRPLWKGPLRGLWEHIHESNRGSTFRFASSVLHWIHCNYWFCFLLVWESCAVPPWSLSETCLLECASRAPQQGGGSNRSMFKVLLFADQQVLNPHATRRRKLHCNFRSAALPKLHCNLGFSAVRMSFWPKASLQQAKNCSATSKKLRSRKVALSCRCPADFKLPRLPKPADYVAFAKPWEFPSLVVSNLFFLLAL